MPPRIDDNTKAADMAVAIFPIGSYIIIYRHRQGGKEMKLTGELKKQVEKQITGMRKRGS